MITSVQRFLESLPPSMHRAEIERQRPDLLPLMVRTGRGWQELLDELGFCCPESLIELGDAAEAQCIHVDDEHGWDLLSPQDARETRQFLAELAAQFPDLVARARMVPVFGQDGDFLLLAGDGRMWAFTHDAWEHDSVVAETFDELLVSWAERRMRFD